MKYTITVNQLGLYYAGLNFKTDWNDWAIIDYLKDFAQHPKSKRIIYNNQEYVWLNYNHLIANLPFAKFNGKWSVSRRISKLRKLGLVKTVRAKDNTLYVAFTDKLIDICWAKKSDIEKMRRIMQSGEKRDSSFAPLTQNNKSVTCKNCDTKKVGQGFNLAIKQANLKVCPTLQKQNYVQKVIHNLPIPVADKSNRGCCSIGATAQIETKYQIETKNNKDISFSSSSKTKTQELKPQRTQHTQNNFNHRLTQINTDKKNTELKPLRTQKITPSCHCEPVSGVAILQPVKDEIASAAPRKDRSSVPSMVKGFKTFSGVWKVVENIRQRGMKQKLTTETQKNTEI